MKRLTNLIFILLFLPLASLHAQEEGTEAAEMVELVEKLTLTAQGNQVTDSSFVSVRTPAPEALDKYRNDGSFDYTETAQNKNLWGEFLSWLFGKLEIGEWSPLRIFMSNYFWYVVFGILVLVLLYVIFKKEIHAIFYRDGKKRLQMEGLEEDIKSIDFDRQVQEAVSSGNYRLAVRLEYLRALHDLDEKELIDWKPDKTNKEYVNELYGNTLYQPFAAITRLFNWIWYGEFEIDAEGYSGASLQFSSFRNQLSGKRR